MKYAVALIGAAVISVGCEDFLSTKSSTDINSDDVEATVAQLEQVLISTYNQFLFNSHTSDSGDRVYAGIPGLQMYYDLRGADIMSHSNMGGSQCSSYNFDEDNTRSNGSYTKAVWGYGYKLINLCNQIIDSLDAASGDEAKKAEIEGQAKAMRAVAYFQLIINYQQTYAIAKDKRGVILRLSKNDPEAMPFSTVEQVYTQILKDLNDANSLLADFEADEPWKISTEVIDGWLARVYLVMENWQKAYDHASKVYANHNTLMTKEQWYSGFDDVISGNYNEVVWAIAYTEENNLGGGTQYNFWDNQDPDTYGEGQSGIYRFFNFYVSEEYVNLFDEEDWRGAKIAKGTKIQKAKQATDEEGNLLWEDEEKTIPTPEVDADGNTVMVTDTKKLEEEELKVMFWERQSSAADDRKGKWVNNKWKHYGVNGNTYPEIPLMRGSEMLLIMAEALVEGATSTDGYTAAGLLNTLQEARGAEATTATVENILIERRKELLGEGVTGQFDLVRRQLPLTRVCETKANPSGHFYYGVDEFPNWTENAETVTLPSNDYRFFKQIPDDEFTYNSAISLADQNPFGSRRQ